MHTNTIITNFEHVTQLHDLIILLHVNLHICIAQNALNNFLQTDEIN